MSELSRSNAIDIVKNAAGDELAIRQLKFRSVTTTTGGERLTVEKPWSQSDMGKKVTLRDPADILNVDKREIRTIIRVGTNDVDLDSALSESYPIGSHVYIVEGEQDIFDTMITDRTEAHGKMIEQSLTEAD